MSSSNVPSRPSRIVHKERDAPPPVGHVRLADVHDAARILALCTESTKTTFRVFGTERIEYLIENSVLAITQLNVNSDIIGFLCLREYPLIPSVAPHAWEEYIWTKYKTIELKARNTVWIHLMCWNRRYNRDVVDAMLRSVYIHDPYLQYICMTKSVVSCPQLIPGASRAEAAFRRVQVVERGIPGDQLPGLLISDRKDVCPRLRVRRAVEEDNDDILPIIDRHSDRLRDMYGEFYVSELVSRHPESERVLLVCEHAEVAVGVMCLNTVINFESLEECFELSPFAGLRKLDSLPKPDQITARYSDLTPESEPSVILDNLVCVSTDTVLKDKQVSEIEAEKKLNSDSVMFEHGKLIGSADLLEYLDLFDEDDEDFDIVNIDPELLRVPYLTASEDHALKNLIDHRTKTDVLHPLAEGPSPKREQKKKPPPEHIIRYSGASNAFLLEMFAMHHEYDERYAFDMLEAAYELFPDQDYCVMCLPSSHAPFPLLEHFTLVTPHSTRMRFVKESLYVAHINSVKGDVSVRPGEPADRQTAVDLLGHTAKLDAAISLFEESLTSHTIKSYMLLAQRQPVGVIITGPLEDGVAIRTQFDLKPEPWSPLSDGVIISGCMSPVMEPHSRWYMRDILRQSRYSTLFWICQPIARGDQDPKRNMMSLAERMAPVRPRCSLPNITGMHLIDKIFKNSSNPFALWKVERPLTSLPKVFVNNSIVVVGASRTGLAFIEKLMLGPSSEYLTFTNLTLVSEHGLPTVAECLKAADTAMPRAGRYIDKYLKSVPFCFYVDVIPDILIDIDRKKKCIHVKGGGLKYYDELVITCGQQFQHPDYLKESLEAVTILRKGLPCERVLMDNPRYQPDRVPPPPSLPDNLFLINSLLEANIVFEKLLNILSQSRDSLSDSNRVVVYGDCIEAYSCMSALLELGLAGEEIAFIENYPPEDTAACRINCFNDEIIDERVQGQLEEIGVKCYRNTRIVKLHIHTNKVNSLSLIDPLHAKQIGCYALFYYGLKAINIDIFKAVNECGLVYDGGLILSPKFETNDPHIYGAGTCCTYSRSLYATNKNHNYHNSEEVGEALADFFLYRFDPFVSCHPNYDSNDLLPKYSFTLHSRSHASIPDVTTSRLNFIQQPPGRSWQPVMKFEQPIVQIATLPGPLYYLKARKPGPDIPMEIQLNLPNQGHILMTDKNGNYFRLRLSVLHCVDAITCLSKDSFSGDLLTRIYGKHEAFFNKLLLRYQMDQIEDLYAYFTQPWLSAFYQETFDELMDNILSHDGGSLYEELKSTYKLNGDDAPEERPSSARRRSSEHLPVSSRISWASKIVSSMDCQTKEKKPSWSLAELLRKYAANVTSKYEQTRGPSDIPTECGQSATVRDDVTRLWDSLGGEGVVVAHTARHLDKYSIHNPHYAPCNPDYY